MAAPSSRSEGRRQVAVLEGQVQPPPDRQHGDAAIRPGRRQRARQDAVRSDGHESARHGQQLRRRRHRLGAPGSPARKTSTVISAAKWPRIIRRSRNRSGSARRRPVRWAKFYDRFDVSKEPNEANRFGWVVEIDVGPDLGAEEAHRPRPVQARGRETIVNKDGRVVLYSGDDERFDYVYKFVTNGKFNPDHRAANWTCSTRARSMSPSSMRTARSNGCRSSMARAR